MLPIYIEEIESNIYDKFLMNKNTIAHIDNFGINKKIIMFNNQTKMQSLGTHFDGEYSLRCAKNISIENGFDKDNVIWEIYLKRNFYYICMRVREIMGVRL